MYFVRKPKLELLAKRVVDAPEGMLMKGGEAEAHETGLWSPLSRGS